MSWEKLEGCSLSTANKWPKLPQKVEVMVTYNSTGKERWGIKFLELLREGEGRGKEGKAGRGEREGEKKEEDGGEGGGEDHSQEFLWQTSQLSYLTCPKLGTTTGEPPFPISTASYCLGMLISSARISSMSITLARSQTLSPGPQNSMTQLPHWASAMPVDCADGIVGTVGLTAT